MSLSEILILAGLLVTIFAARSFSYAILRHLALLGFLLLSFLIGYFLTNEWWVGTICVLIWFFFPWLDLLTRIRTTQIPLDQKLTQQFAPNREIFPELPVLSEQLESLGFEFTNDIGCKRPDQSSQFYRIFNAPDHKTQALICLQFQGDIGFAYLSFRSITKHNLLFISTTYPFSSALKLPPHFELNKITNDPSMDEAYTDHNDFLLANGIDICDLVSINAEELPEFLESEHRQQVEHNLQIGLLKPMDPLHIQYSWKGLFYLWLQFLRDFIRHF